MNSLPLLAPPVRRRGDRARSGTARRLFSRGDAARRRGSSCCCWRSRRSRRSSRSTCRSRAADRRCRSRTRWTSPRCCCSVPTRRWSSPRRAPTASAPSASRNAIPIHRTLFSMACLVAHRAGRGPGLHDRSAACPACSTGTTIAQPLVGAATTYFVINTLAIATRDRAVDAPVGAQGLERELPLERAELLRRRRRRRRVGVDGDRSRALARGAGRRRRSTSPIAPTRSISAASTTSSGTCARWRICTSRRSKRWRWRSTPRIRRRSRTSAACSSTPPPSRARSA